MSFPDVHSPEAMFATPVFKSQRLPDNRAAMRASTTSAAGIRTLSSFARPAPVRGRNAAMSPLNGSDPIHRRIEQHAASHAQEIAVISGGQKITCGELNARANRLARYLRRMAPSPATPVGIFIEPRIGTVICLLAALKAGNPYIPLDPNGAPMQTAATLAETEAFVLLPSESTPACLPARRARAISIESEFESIECGSTGNLSRGDAEGLGRVAFHEFATGQRGLAISHRACLDSVESFRASLGLTSADWFITTPRPDLALSGMWVLTPLAYGARLILAPGAEDGIGELALDQIERSRAVVLRATPATAAALLSAKWQVRSRLKLIRGAEVWPDELLKTLDAMGVEVWQLHGTAVNYRLGRNEAGADSAALRAAANGGQS
jgi:non-ribosomal peptide synthetase component F